MQWSLCNGSLRAKGGGVWYWEESARIETDALRCRLYVRRLVSSSAILVETSPLRYLN